MKNMYEYVAKYAESLQARVAELAKELEDAPAGNLRIRRRPNGRVYYYAEECNNRERHTRYLPKTEEELITKYGQKKYAQLLLDTLKQNLAACDEFLALHSQKEESEIADEMDPLLLSLIPDLERSTKSYCARWLARPYPVRNLAYPEDLKHKTLKGDLVRSKSEAMIADALFRADIPYLYEYPLWLPELNYAIFPDFTVLDPCTMMERYWEHFGMMDNPEYASRFVERWNQYGNAGIFVGDGLIASMETRECPLSSWDVEHLVETYFSIEL